MDRDLNFKMITLARETRSITQSELAKSIPNLTQGNLSRMEMGILPIPDETIMNIAKFLKYPVPFFYKKEARTPISNFYYRKRLTIPKKVLARIESQMDIVRISIDELIRSIELPEFNFPGIDISFSGNPEDAARKIRDFLKLPKGPIDNLVRILEKQGILIYMFEAQTDKFDGITLFTDKGQPIMFINKNLSNDRKRFTIGHELGHLVLHIPFVIDNNRDEEVEANLFSSEFNMPYMDCRNDLINLKYSDLGRLKGYWKLSKAAILYRAKQINAITEEKYKYLVIELSRRGERKLELGHPIELDEPVLLKQMVKVLLNDLGYKIEELAALLGLSEFDFNFYFGISSNNNHLRIVI